MFAHLAHKARERRAAKYLKAYPEDEPAVAGILFHCWFSKMDNVKQVAEIIARAPIADEKWEIIRPRWDRAWNYIVGNST